MKSIRIHPIDEDNVLIDIVCDCGNNDLKYSKSKKSFDLQRVNGRTESTRLSCKCGKEILVEGKIDHIQVVG